MRISDWSSDVCSSDLQLARLGDELLHDLELRRGRRLGLDTPTLRKNRQLLDGPALVLIAVAFGRNRLHQMTDAPGHDDTGATVAAVAAVAGTQHTGDVLALGRLLAQEHAHEASLKMCGSSDGRQLGGARRCRQQGSRLMQTDRK